MVDRYKGREDLVDINQVADYLVDNYVTRDGDPLRQAIALALCQHDIAWEWIQNGVANRAFVYYIGDMIADRAELDEIPDDDDEWKNEESGEGG